MQTSYVKGMFVRFYPYKNKLKRRRLYKIVKIFEQHLGIKPVYGNKTKAQTIKVPSYQMKKVSIIEQMKLQKKFSTKVYPNEK